MDYLDDLGVDAVWLNPVYASPMADNGYDISDYRSINPAFGTMADWEELLAELHDRGMRLIMDLVVNHTSDEHEWFERSRAGERPYDDYYYWRDGRPADGADYDTADGPDDEVAPNNWESFFSTPAWSYDDGRGQWYLHLFDEKQPDLNWRKPAVREEVYGMMNWWLEKGIDGFRMDVINLISKPEGLPDGDPAAVQTGVERFVSGPNFPAYLSEMIDETVGGTDAVTVGEMIGVDAAEARAYVGEGGLSMVIHFEHLEADTDAGRWDPTDLDLPAFKRVITDWQEELAEEGWNCLYLSNHDQPRAVSRFGDDGEYRVESATMLATLLFTLRGTPFVYQGQEIGMTNADFETRESIRDVSAANAVDYLLATDEYDSYEEVRPIIESRSRDNARTPVQWNDGENAGFTGGVPWIDVNPNHDRINVAAARADRGSVWHYYRRLIDLRRRHDVFVYGDYDLLSPEHPAVFAFRRTLADVELLVACNFAESDQRISLPASDGATDRLIGNYDGAPEGTAGGETRLRPCEAWVIRRTPSAGSGE